MPPEEAISEDDALPANIALAGHYRSYRQAFEEAVVILAMNLPYWHVHKSERHELYVESACLPQVIQELQAYREEQAHWNPQAAAHGLIDYPLSFYLPYLGSLLLIISFILQHAYAPTFGAAGRMDAVGFLGRHEWWRPATALFLHGDVDHLLGNLVFGLWYGVLVNRGYGKWLGWCLILGSGALGNALVSLYHFPQDHFSIGAYTAVFGALGLLVAEGFAQRWHQGFATQLGQLFIPIIAGGILLSWTGGFGNPGVDALAHVAGFLCGILLGVSHWFLKRKEDVDSM